MSQLFSGKDKEYFNKIRKHLLSLLMSFYSNKIQSF